MRTIWRNRFICTISGLALCLFCSAVRADESAIQTLQYYFDLLSSENFETASMLWTPEAQERSGRFGITYPDVSVRVDATSPVVRNLPTMRYHVTPAAKQAINLADNGRWVQMEYNSIVNDKVVKWPYFAVKSGAYYSLMYPQDYYCRNWPITESKYFRIHSDSSKTVYLNPAALEEADLFVDRICDTLKIDKATRAQIAQSKIEYFFCGSDSSVATITGQHTKGLLDEASNDIISADFPHFHEVLHLLVNISLKEIPLTTLPLLREGYAVQQAGRWGKRSGALMDLGIYLYKEKLVELDSILTAPGFESSGGADIAYPVSGVFCAYLESKVGLPAFWTLYRQCSYTDYTLDTLSQLEVRRRLVQATDASDWNSFVADFDSYLNRIGETVALVKAGTLPEAKEVLKGDYFTITQTKDWCCFELSNDTGVIQGNLMFGKDPRLQGKRSHLFEEQYGFNQPYGGYRYGVRFDQNEAGLYDYATNELVAKYIWGITPSDEYFDKTNRTVRIRFRSALLRDALSKKEICQMLPL